MSSVRVAIVNYVDNKIMAIRAVPFTFAIQFPFFLLFLQPLLTIIVALATMRHTRMRVMLERKEKEKERMPQMTHVVAEFFVSIISDHRQAINPSVVEKIFHESAKINVTESCHMNHRQDILCISCYILFFSPYKSRSRPRNQSFLSMSSHFVMCVAFQHFR